MHSMILSIRDWAKIHPRWTYLLSYILFWMLAQILSVFIPDSLKSQPLVNLVACLFMFVMISLVVIKVKERIPLWTYLFMIPALIILSGGAAQSIYRLLNS
jgi:hypothetical protein